MPVLWSGEFRGLYSPWGCKESDTTEQLSLHLQNITDFLLFSFFKNLTFLKRLLINGHAAKLSGSIAGFL